MEYAILPPFESYGKIPRLNRDIVITEKLDGTNAQLFIADNPDGSTVLFPGSRNRWITPEDDNYGFAAWAYENKRDLIDLLGPGRHFGEWWGSGIQRGYGLPSGEKRFSLFNTHRWVDIELKSLGLLHTVPILYEGPFAWFEIDFALKQLRSYGSEASPGYTSPEGIVVYHKAANQLFKVTLEGDEAPKSVAA